MATTILPLNVALQQAQACLAQGDGRQALVLMQAAVMAAPDSPAAHTGHGVALRFAGQMEAAADAFLRVLALQPEQANAQVFLGMIRLAQGRQAEGWALYQARWRDPGWVEKMRYPAHALWQGRVSTGLRLLLWCEQGFGDALQFCRYAPWLLAMLRSHGATLILEAPAPLCPLLRACWPGMDIVPQGQVRGQIDAHLPLLDLPFRWGNLVGEGGLPYQPAPLPYLSALPDLLRERRGACPVPSERPPLRVGIAWQGRPSHPDDRWRSLRPAQLEGLFQLPGVCWISLQKDGADHPPWLPDEIAHCVDFADTARIVDSLDLIISIDSAVAHLAGALGRPVWLLLPKIVDWRWQLTGETTPWYPTMRLFRQAEHENWSDVTSRVGRALMEFIAST